MTVFNVMKKIGLWILITLVVVGSVSAKEEITIIEKSDSFLRGKITFPIPDIQTVILENKEFSQISMSDYPVFAQNGKYAMPYFALLLHMYGKDASIHILSEVKTDISILSPEEFQPDIALGKEGKENVSGEIQNISGQPGLRKIGSLEGNELWAADFYPYHYNPATEVLTVSKEIVFEIRLNANSGGILVPQVEREKIASLGALSLASRKSTTPASLSKAVEDVYEKWKILVAEDGFYHITGYDLSEAGVRLADVDVKKLKLTSDGKNIPIYVHGWEDGSFDADDYFEFWGEYHRYKPITSETDIYTDPYSSTNVYVLSWNADQTQWMVDEEAQVSSTAGIQYISPTFFHDTVHEEKDVYFERFGTIANDVERDHWFYDSGIRSGQKQVYTIELWDPDVQSTESIECRISMSGRTSSDTLMHSVAVYLNDSYLYQSQWWGQNFIEMNLEGNNAPSGVDLENGSNTISILNTGDPQYFDYVLFNWANITYPRLYRAHENQLKFTVPQAFEPGTYVFKIDGFDKQKVDVYKINTSKMLGVDVEAYTESNSKRDLYKISFQDVVTSAETKYVAVTQDAKLKPVAIVQDEPTQLKSSQVSADYIIISHPRFLEVPAVDELIDLRQSQGLQTLKIDINDIYDEFNHGKVSAYAIKDFISYAYHNWSEPQLKYVLLLGDGCYLRYTEDDTLDLVPAYMRQTFKFGAAASDYWYTLVDGDDEIPDLNIGRIPARETEEVEKIINKIIAYETSAPSGDWRNRILYIGGNDILFRQQGLTLSQTAPKDLNTEMLFTYRDQTLANDPYFGGTLDLLDYFNNGCTVMTFHGHGGGAIWADNGLLRIEDAEQINCDSKLAFILSMTCFTGSFESPSRESLADALLFAENEGIVAMLGASGYGWELNDYLLEREILNYMYKHPHQTIGEIVNAGKVLYYSKYNQVQSKTEVNQYHIFGDPATRLVLPTQKAAVSLDLQILQKGETFTVNAEFPFSDGSGTIAVIDSAKNDVMTRDFFIVNGKTSSQLVVDPGFESLTGAVRVFAENDLGTEQANGSALFSLSQVLFDSSRIAISTSDSIRYFAKILSSLELDSIFCVTLGDTLTMSAIGNNWYKSDQGIRNTNSMEISYQFIVKASSGRVYKSIYYVDEKKKGADLTFDHQSIKLEGETQVELTARILNYGDTDAFDIPVQFYISKDDSLWQPLSSKTVQVSAYSFADISLPVSLPAGRHLCRLEIDPDSLYRDTNFYNNFYNFYQQVDLFNFVPGTGIQYGTSYLDTLALDSTLTLYVPKSVMAENGVFGFEKQDSVTIFEQPDFQSLYDVAVYDINVPGMAGEFVSPVQVRFILSDTVQYILDSTAVDYSIFTYSDVSKKWSRLETEKEDSLLTASLYSPGLVTVLTSQDTQLPDVEVSIDGQPYSKDKYISPDPKFTLVFQDDNGILVESIKVILNGAEQSMQNLGIPDTVLNANQITAKLTPDLTTGSHTMNVRCMDCNGNLLISKEYSFKTAEKFDVQMLGNYPNPFQDETLFAYFFTIPVDKVELKIYTASGRLIRDLNPLLISSDPNPLSADYHEVQWDALDMNGNQLANGVYFYKLTVTANGETKKIMGKIAKLK